MKTILALILSLSLTVPAAFAVSSSDDSPKNIVELVVSNPDVNGDDEGDFDILLAAVKSADPSIAEALSGENPLTVFAPTDSAFEMLLEKLGLSAEELLANTQLLNDVLLYHVTSGRQDAASVTSMKHIEMLDGNKAGISMNEKGAYINDARIIGTDVEGGNGLVHIIDTVLLPPSK
jgi:uncharacterized surface protein with fasciclin (FAS1) repeats